jgi:hypothetical protein
MLEIELLVMGVMLVMVVMSVMVVMVMGMGMLSLMVWMRGG